MIALLVACAQHRPDPVPTDQATVVRLQDLPFAEGPTIPDDVRPDHAPPPQRIPLKGPWHRDAQGQRKGWTAPMPTRPRGLFFFKAETGTSVLDTAHDDGTLPYDAAWTHDRDSISIWLPDLAEAPPDDRFVLVDPLATERESALNLDPSGKTAADFAWTTIQDGWDARSGLLLPAPGAAAWDLDVPAGAELTFTSGIVEPEIRDAADSDGAELTMTVEADGATTEVWSGPLAARSFQPHRVDLSRFAGKHVRLRFRSDPLGSPTFDYVFVAEPVVASRKADPVTVLLVFVDTLRADHTSLYGYSRDTTAPLDPLQTTSAVFEHAYSTAPWTLPSSRSIITGRQPEEYFQAVSLPEILGKKGFATAFFAGNVYLSTNFAMQRGWDLHRVGGIFPSARQPTDDALQWLADHQGRDAVVQVHYMDAHLPYHEPEEYRYKYAAAANTKLGERFELNDVRRAGIANDKDAQQYIRDRYDDNIRYVADQVARLVEKLDDNDVLLIYADHGEEFWDHARYEHGHSLFDELLHVPLLIRAPGLPAGRIDEPVSLLDLVPTVLELTGQPIPPEIEGRSLVGLIQGQAGSKAEFAARDVAFGRPLYGAEQWGVLHRGDKWTTTEGRESLYTLRTDPGEKKNQFGGDSAQGGPYREALAGALDRPVRPGYRLAPTAVKGPANLDLLAVCTVPGGFARVWPGADPLVQSMATTRGLENAEIAPRLADLQITDHPVSPDDGGVEICWPRGFSAGREVYLVPNRPLAEVGRQMACSAFLGSKTGGKRATLRIPPDRDPDLGQNRAPLARIGFDQRQLVWTYGAAPFPGPGEDIQGADPEMDGILVQLGYTSRDGTPAPEGEAREKPRECEIPAVQLKPMASTSGDPDRSSTSRSAAPGKNR